MSLPPALARRVARVRRFYERHNRTLARTTDIHFEDGRAHPLSTQAVSSREHRAAEFYRRAAVWRVINKNK